MMNESVRHEELLLLQSLENAVTHTDQQLLSKFIQDDHVLRRHHDQYQRIRTAIKKTEPSSFGPFFAERIMHMVKQRKQELDYQILFFFKKYQLIIVGVLVALLIVNLLLSDDMSLRGIFGLDKSPDTNEFSIDLYDYLPD